MKAISSIPFIRIKILDFQQFLICKLINPNSKSKSDFGFSLKSQLTIYAAVPQVYAAVPWVYAAVHWVYAAVPSPGKV